MVVILFSQNSNYNQFRDDFILFLKTKKQNQPQLGGGSQNDDI